ncbi:unnamed protein product [Periconia digitata]|uniref:Uncharacterized protein n=1 Tax=Periconia digitata TaxID=1303443 RepID=A0A9W4UNZ7_9PLEO|nr:unnamed protein product [Periconia digitata]
MVAARYLSNRGKSAWLGVGTAVRGAPYFGSFVTLIMRLLFSAARIGTLWCECCRNACRPLFWIVRTRLRL